MYSRCGRCGCWIPQGLGLCNPCVQSLHDEEDTILRKVNSNHRKTGRVLRYDVQEDDWLDRVPIWTFVIVAGTVIFVLTVIWLLAGGAR